MTLLVWNGAAHAACTPALIGGETNVTASCSGNVANQNPPAGYGTGNQTNISVGADGTSNITGTQGIWIGSGSVTLAAGGVITGTSSGVVAATGALEVINGGTITGQGSDGIRGLSTTNVLNVGTITGSFAGINAGGGGTIVNAFSSTISGGYGINALGSVNLANSGTLSGSNVALYAPSSSVTVFNSESGTISGASGGIQALTADVVNTGNITSTGGAAIRTSGSTTLVNNMGGRVSGSTYGVQAGGGGSSITNAGTITGGTAAILFTGSGNTLTIAPTSIINGIVTGGTNNTLQLGGDGFGTFNLSSIGSSSQYQNFSELNITGPATWTLEGTNSLARAIAVNGGTLMVNSTLTSASGVSVNRGGTLGGTGTIVGPTTINGGTLSPGSSIGTLSISGNLAFTTAATYLVEIDPTASDRTNVTGTATLGGATVSAVFADGSYVARSYTILNAQGGVVGTFGSLVSTNLPTNFTATLTYDTNNVFLNIALNFAAAPTYAPLTTNQRNVATGLVNSFNSARGIPLVFGALSAAGLTQISGEHATGVQHTTFDAMDKFVNLLTDPFTSGRSDAVAGGSPQTGATGYADEDESLAYAAKRARSGAEREAYAAFKAPPRAAALERRWSVWGAGYGGTQRTDGDAITGSQRIISHVYGGAAGFDYRLTPDTMVGFALGGAGTRFGVDQALGGGRSDMFQAGVYGRYAQGPAYVTGALAWGWQDVTTDRTVFGNRYRGNFDANALTGRLEGGWRFAYGASGITPYAAGQFTSFWQPDYAEQLVAGVNTFALAYSDRNVTASRNELGLRGDTSFAAADAVITLRGRAAWAHNYNTRRSVDAIFQALPVSNFTVFGASPARDGALVSAGVEAKWLNGISVAANFEGEFSSRTDAYAGKALVRYQW